MYSDNETLEQKVAWLVLPVVIGLYNAVGILRRLWQWARYKVSLWKLWVLAVVAVVLFTKGLDVLVPFSKLHPNITGVPILLIGLNLYVTLFVVVMVTCRRASDSLKRATLKLYRDL